ncbi:nuclear transport factor 2 family protein [Halomonas vilamensis]|uniref:Nuclear transport factor 2 family protein n=1 Tax=Vreelandella vilamensis TaxID=531309 RepID=A0ABU1H5A2_9GAMM|nr:nuclear transport factor 2 family protein [Halomonas vilamensis]MDR5899031.1 nuclear transport factor 2 family protein [Halomonas vilamensis]
MPHETALETFCAFFNKLDNTCTEKLYEVYTDDIVFRDPLHHVEGRAALEGYFAAMYENVTECRFTYYQKVCQGNTAFVTWTMHFAHPSLASGKVIAVEGCSHLIFADDGRVSQHRDYFDAGAMLYEHVPILGRLIRLLKRRIK